MSVIEDHLHSLDAAVLAMEQTKDAVASAAQAVTTIAVEQTQARYDVAAQGKANTQAAADSLALAQADEATANQQAADTETAANQKAADDLAAAQTAADKAMADSKANLATLYGDLGITPPEGGAAASAPASPSSTDPASTSDSVAQ